MSIALTALLFGLSLSAHSFEFDQAKAYAGGGAAMNNNGDESAFGFQGFGGYDFKDDIEIADTVSMAAEVGYTYSGEWDFGFGGKFKIKGPWVAAVFSIDFSDEIDIVNRIGWSFADKNADGLITGLGLDYHMDEQLTIRGEIVMQGYKGFQLGALYRFGS